MGKRRGRLSAKTGDRSISKRLSSRKSSADSKLVSSYDEDDMFDEVDAYHNKKEAKFNADFVHLDGGETSCSDDDDGIVYGREEVLGLGVPASSEEEDEGSEDGDDDAEGSGDGEGRYPRGDEESTSTSKSFDDDTEDNDDDEKPLDSILDWGGKKRGYYGGGETVDLDNKQDMEDAYLEEQAAKEVQQARYGAMSEDDFFDSIPLEGKKKLGTLNEEDYDDGMADIVDFDSPTSMFLFDNDATNKSVVKPIPQKNLDTLSLQEKIHLLAQQSPEFIPLTQHFKSTAVEQYRDNILVVAEQLLSQPNQSSSVGTTALGKQYLRHKQMLLVSTMINLCMYLLIKLDNDSSTAFNIKDHPVIMRLNQLQDLADKLRIKVEEPLHLLEQLDTLTKAAALVRNGEVDTELNDDNNYYSSEVEENVEDKVGQGNQDTSSADDDEEKQEEEEATVSSASNQSEDRSHSVQDSRNALVEARYGVRIQDIDNDSSLRLRRSVPDTSDFGDDEVEEQHVQRARKKLSSTVNTISQREKTRSQKFGQNRNTSGDMENEFDRRENEKLQAGIDLMEQMLGKASDDEDMEDNARRETSDNNGSYDESFYERVQQKSKARKERKEATYKVLPKYPVMEEEADGERAVGRMIMKNRGLVPHKAKINRNPRVKKREQYRKALIRRKGAVREVRTNESEKYGGELTGIKTNLSRSRKLGAR